MLTSHGMQVNVTYDKYALREKVTRSINYTLDGETDGTPQLLLFTKADLEDRSG